MAAYPSSVKIPLFTLIEVMFNRGIPTRSLMSSFAGSAKFFFPISNSSSISGTGSMSSSLTSGRENSVTMNFPASSLTKMPPAWTPGGCVSEGWHEGRVAHKQMHASPEVQDQEMTLLPRVMKVGEKNHVKRGRTCTHGIQRRIHSGTASITSEKVNTILRK
jgi:hypothetical protein